MNNTTKAYELEPIGSATYSPEDNKLRIKPFARPDAETYARVKSAGYIWAPKQGQFVAPMWTPERAELAAELCGEIGDEDTTLAERAEDRAERFEEYSDKRAEDAARSAGYAHELADGVPFGQPILVGHHSERHARKVAQKIENATRRAVNMWETSEYWTRRAAGAIRAAKYKERPDVRARRIKGIEADIRKLDKTDKEDEATLKLWSFVDDDTKWKTREDGTKATREERASMIAGRVSCYVCPNDRGTWWSAYDILRLPAEDRYKGTPEMTIDEVIERIKANKAASAARRNKWRDHYNNRLAYERAMLAEGGGLASDKIAPEVGGAVRCLWAPRGGWAYIKKVNKVTVTIFHKWNEGADQKMFRHNEPLDKLYEVMSREQVEAHRAAGKIREIDERGFYLLESREQFDAREAAAGTPNIPEAEQTDKNKTAATIEAMRETLRNGGVQAVSAPQLFPTPRDLAQRMADMLDVQLGDRVLEPSAGTGMLLGALGGRMFDHGSNLPTYAERNQVHAVEINRALAGKLQAEFPLTEVHCADFLDFQPDDFVPFDRIIMNPPFENGSDIKHILHARKMLKPGGLLVGICADGPRQKAALEPLAAYWEELPAGTFEGTGVRTVLFTMEG